MSCTFVGTISHVGLIWILSAIILALIFHLAAEALDHDRWPGQYWWSMLVWASTALFGWLWFADMIRTAIWCISERNIYGPHAATLANLSF